MKTRFSLARIRQTRDGDLEIIVNVFCSGPSIS